MSPGPRYLALQRLALQHKLAMLVVKGDVSVAELIEELYLGDYLQSQGAQWARGGSE